MIKYVSDLLIHKDYVTGVGVTSVIGVDNGNVDVGHIRYEVYIHYFGSKLSKLV